MRVHVHYLGPVRVRLNKKEEDVDVAEKASLLDLLKGLSSTYGDWFRKEILKDDEKGVAEGMVITVNGIAMGQLGGLAARLKDGDEVMLLPFFAGGGSPDPPSTTRRPSSRVSSNPISDRSLPTVEFR